MSPGAGADTRKLKQQGAHLPHLESRKAPQAQNKRTAAQHEDSTAGTGSRGNVPAQSWTYGAHASSHTGLIRGLKSSVG